MLGGDYALFGPWPRETVELLDGLDADWIRGNGDRWTAHPADAPDHRAAGRHRRLPELLGDECR